MKLKGILVIVLASLILLVSSQKGEKPYKGPSEVDVIELSPTNYQEIVYSSSEPWLVFLHASWCEHCKVMRPEWAKLATSLKGKIKVAKVDPSDNAYRPRFFKLYQLVSFPRIIMLPAGPKSEGVYDVFEGARTALAIEQWAMEQLKKHKASAVNQILSQQTWQESCIEPGSSICVVALLPSLLDSSDNQRSVYLQIVRSVARNFRDRPVSFLWGVAGDHPDFETLFNLSSGFPAVVLINPGRNVFTTMKAALTEQAMQEWMEEVFRSKGGRRFSRFNREITFNTVELDERVNSETLDGEEL